MDGMLAFVPLLHAPLFDVSVHVLQVGTGVQLFWLPRQPTSQMLPQVVFRISWFKSSVSPFPDCIIVFHVLYFKVRYLFQKYRLFLNKFTVIHRLQNIDLLIGLLLVCKSFWKCSITRAFTWPFLSWCIVLYWWAGDCCRMDCDLKTYCAPPNLHITRTWICRLNVSQKPIFFRLEVI